MVKLEAAPLLEGRTVADARILNVAVKTITPRNKDEKPFRIAEFQLGELQGPIRDVMGSGTLRVGLSCDRVSVRSRLGQLAHGLFGWNGKTELDTDDFIGQRIEFVVEPKTNEKGTFFEVDRHTIGMMGHLSGPQPEELVQE